MLSRQSNRIGGSVKSSKKRSGHTVLAGIVMALLATGCGSTSVDSAVDALCAELLTRSPGLSGDVVVREGIVQDLRPSLDEARDHCPEHFPTGGDVIFVKKMDAIALNNDCNAVVNAAENSIHTPDDLENLFEAVVALRNPTNEMLVTALDGHCQNLPAEPDVVLAEASSALLCNIVDLARDGGRTSVQQSRALDQLVKLLEMLPGTAVDATIKRCGDGAPDSETLIDGLVAGIAAQVEEEESMAAAAAAQEQETAREAAETADRERRAQIAPGLLQCYDSYYAASYLSAQALRASTCIVDALFFGGVTPTRANTSELMPEMIFHATWASWDEATRSTVCGDVKRRGFDAAETYGIAMTRPWQAQIRAAGSSWSLDDYDLVLELLDTCESY